jgi:hypothetical protein
MKMTSNGKTLNYRVVDLVESYNFHINFTSIRVQTKKQIFEKRLDPYRCGPVAGGATVPRASYRRGCGVRCIISFADHIFFSKLRCKKRKKFRGQKRLLGREWIQPTRPWDFLRFRRGGLVQSVRI